MKKLLIAMSLVAFVVNAAEKKPLTEAERQIIADGCLINYYRNH